ncbi:hypothetical protein CEXT_524501 [Caerostris extrusa]|uniref:Uncharacterized protein n=1 Tax=Caerostris extrusa TaxID=172846 RepID=A0AAV4XM67_CAEEX|nr:hypothetical protein CEXT_524501 [Caerostris extrusa]
MLREILPCRAVRQRCRHLQPGSTVIWKIVADAGKHQLDFEPPDGTGPTAVICYTLNLFLQQTLEQWNKIFMICNGIVLSSGIIFFIFGSAEVQKWNYPSVTEAGKVCPPVDKDKKELHAETFQADITIHL